MTKQIGTYLYKPIIYWPNYKHPDAYSIYYMYVPHWNYIMAPTVLWTGVRLLIDRENIVELIVDVTVGLQWGVSI